MTTMDRYRKPLPINRRKIPLLLRKFRQKPNKTQQFDLECSTTIEHNAQCMRFPGVSFYNSKLYTKLFVLKWRINLCFGCSASKKRTNHKMVKAVGVIVVLSFPTFVELAPRPCERVYSEINRAEMYTTMFFYHEF